MNYNDDTHLFEFDENDKAKMFEYGIPAYMHEHLIAYFAERRPVGDFLTNLLRNDLMATFDHADNNNAVAIKAYTMWLYNWAPARSYKVWGSPEAVKNWLSGKKLGVDDDDDN